MFTIKIGQMTVNNVLCANEPAVNYHLTPQLHQGLQGICVSFSSVFWFSAGGLPATAGSTPASGWWNVMQRLAAD